MKTNKIKVYISTANQCLHLMKIFSYLFNKFWDPDQEVVVLGYDEPTFELPNNFSFISLGKQEEGGEFETWTTDLRKYFESIDDKHIIWATEDQFLTYKVNFDILNKLILLLNDDNVGRIGLTNDMIIKPYDFFGKLEDCDVIIRHQDVEYRLAGISSIWNRDYFLKYLLPNWSPWEWEVCGSEMAKNDGYKILGTFGNYAVRLCNAIRKRGVGYPLDFRFINEIRVLDNESIEELKRKGFIDENFIAAR